MTVSSYGPTSERKDKVVTAGSITVTIRNLMITCSAESDATFSVATMGVGPSSVPSSAGGSEGQSPLPPDGVGGATALLPSLAAALNHVSGLGLTSALVTIADSFVAKASISQRGWPADGFPLAPSSALQMRGANQSTVSAAVKKALALNYLA